MSIKNVWGRNAGKARSFFYVTRDWLHHSVQLIEIKPKFLKHIHDKGSEV